MDNKWKPCPGFPEQLILSLVSSFSHQDIQKLLIRRQDESIIFTSRECTEKAFKNVCDSCEQWFSQLLGTKEELVSEEEDGGDEGAEDKFSDDAEYHNNSDEDWEATEQITEKTKKFTKYDTEENKVKTIKKEKKPEILTCGICKEVFHSSPFWSATKKLFKHEQDIHELNLIMCQECGTQFKNKRELDRHVKKNHFSLPLSKCEICGSEVKFLEAHKKLQHSDLPKRPQKQFICELCGKVFKYKEGHRAHMGTYHTGEKTFSCNVCGKSYYRRQGRDRCVKNHQGKENFKHNCGFCGKRFLDKVKLTLHLRTHTREKPYSCPLCNYNAARRDYMTKHISSQHKETTIPLLQQTYPDFLSTPAAGIVIVDTKTLQS